MAEPENSGAWLALILARGIGPRCLRQMSEFLDSPANWPQASRAELRRCGLTASQIEALHHPDPQRLKRCQAWLENREHHLITLDHDLYPPLLKRIDDPPAALFAVGNIGALVRPQVAIVGSRNATPGGLDHARDFAATFARAGFVVTSGLAAGVDASAHEGCLDAGGMTIAVTGTGPEQVYPARNKDLARRTMTQGALITPFIPGTPIRPGNFPARNRIISGMSLGTLVIEAGLRSGSLITARLANEQGREVFAIPGSIHNPLARGCHRLIREGAKLVETAEEVVEELAPLAGELADRIRELLASDLSSESAQLLELGPDAPHVDADPEYIRLLDAIGFDPTPVDDIIRRSELTTAAVSSMLLIMELDGRVAAHPGGRYSRTGTMAPDKDRSE